MILFIDKPSGVTSFDVIRQLRKQLGIRKMGHSGTLDPLATGLLIIATENDTKKLTEFLKLDKEYEGELEFGKVSDTYDVDGKVLSVPESEELISRLDATMLENAFQKFIGEIEQTPPKFSAIKIRGKPAYKYARRGEAVEIPKRKVKVMSFELLSMELPRVKFRIHCGSGAYVRSLVHDLGQFLGVGAIVTSLRRTKIGSYTVATAMPLLTPANLCHSN